MVGRLSKVVLFLLLRALGSTIIAVDGTEPVMAPPSPFLELPRIEVASLDFHTFAELAATGDLLRLQADLLDLHGDDGFSQSHSGDAIFQVSRDQFRYHFGGTNCRFVRLHPATVAQPGESRWLAQELVSEGGCQYSAEASVLPYTMPARREPFVYVLAIFSAPDQITVDYERILRRVIIPAPGVLSLANELLDDIRVAAFVIVDEPDPSQSPLEPSVPVGRRGGGEGRRDSCQIM